ncbi:bile acid:sodium symporter [Gordonia alkaliphila]|uniref:Arsenic resistance protein n=1 Tax=Gordonia alkaliphila TaxID=1053547 RepID=A0ABP8Z942_9ACTN
MAALERHQVACYLGALATAMLVGVVLPGQSVHLGGAITPLLAALLFVTFLQVPVAQLVRRPPAGRFLPTILLLNFVVVPVLVAALFPLLPDERAVELGVLLVLLCPCVDYVIVFAGLAGGDAARLLAATPVLLVLQMLALPLYLWLFLGADLASVVDPWPFLQAFGALIVAPLALAWAAQWWSGRAAAGRRVVGAATAAMVPLMAAVLFVVVASQVPHLDGRAGRWWSVAAVYVLFIAVMAVVGGLASRRAGLDTGERRAAIFAGVTRNSLVVLPLALALPDAFAATAAAVVLLQTLVELVAMVTMVRLVPRWVR